MLSVLDLNIVFNCEFGHGAYIEMHAGLHTLGWYKSKTNRMQPLGYKESGNINYYVTAEAYDDELYDLIYEITIVKRLGKRAYSAKEARRYGIGYYYDSENLFKGNLDTVEDLLKLLKQIGICN